MEQTFKHSFKVSKLPSLALAVHNVGFQKCQGHHGWGPAVRDHYLIHYVVSGQGTLQLEGNTYELGSGQVFLVRPDCLVHYQADGQNPWEYYWVGFSGSLAGQFLDQTGFVNADVLTLDNGSRFRQALLDIYTAHGSDYVAGVSMAGYLQVALSLLMDKAPPQGADATMAYAKQAADYIRRNYAQSITVETVAAQVGVSRSYLYRVFQGKYGCSPRDFLTQHRMGRACQLLSHTDLSIQAIATSVGYDDPLYFSRTFHRCKGVPPSKYRQETSP